MEHPFQKIRLAKEQMAEQKQRASEAGVLNPRGLGGPVFNDMKELLDTLGVSEGEKALGDIRRLYEARFRRKGLDIYNTFLVGEKGSPTHHIFSRDLEKQFLYGFQLYLKVYLRLDAKTAPRPHGPYEASTMGGRGKMLVHDTVTEDEYLRQYIAEGKEMRLPRKDDTKHDFDRDNAMEGYSKKYQNVLPEDESRGALASYMFEKFRVYEVEFFANVTTALQSGVDLGRALDFGTYTYGLDAAIVGEMTEFGFEPNETADYAMKNRTRGEKVFQTYKAIGPRLEKDYAYKDEKGNKHPWVRGPKIIRHFIFKYPDTVEAGVRVLDSELPRLREVYPQVPERILIEVCIKSPDAYQANIDKFLADYEEVSKSIGVPSAWLPAQQDETPALAFYHVSTEAMINFFRENNKKSADGENDKKSKKSLEEAMQKGEMIHARLRTEAESEGLSVSYRTTRQVLRSALLRNISRTKAFDEAKRFQDREIKEHQALYDVAVELYPNATDEELRYYVELGFGDTPEEIVRNGALVAELLFDEKNRAEAELYIEDCIDLYYRYLDAGFPQDKESLKALKDSLMMDMVNPKDFYEQVLKRVWPVQIPVLHSVSEDIE